VIKINIMKIHVLGGHGGGSLGFSTTSFLINNELLIDAGSITAKLTVQEQSEINHILISHSHLDHVKDLPFLCDNCFGMRPSPFKVYTNQRVKGILMDHLFNDTIWPDFTVLPNKENPTVRFETIRPELPFKIEGGRETYTITSVLVQHPNEAMGFIVEDSHGAVLFSMDTGPTTRLWEVAKEFKNLKAIFTEVSFPNSLQAVALASDHHTPQSLKEELKKMPPHIPVVLTHLKPSMRERIFDEISQLQEPRLQVLQQDGEDFEF
jgi:ribonuclease BN (tRNA processing enzyme)